MPPTALARRMRGRLLGEIGELRVTQVLDALNESLGPHIFPARDDGADPRVCQTCGTGQLSLKVGKFGAFIGCSNYPECRFTRPIAQPGQLLPSPTPAPFMPAPAPRLSDPPTRHRPRKGWRRAARRRYRSFSRASTAAASMASIAAAAATVEAPRLVIVATGLLQDSIQSPEKRLADLDPARPKRCSPAMCC